MEVGTKIVLSAKDQASAVFNRVAKSLEPLTKGLETAKNKMDQLQKKTEGVRKAFTKVGEGISDVGKKMAIGITAPVVAGAALSVNAFGDFQKSMAQVKSNLDETSFGAVSVSDGFKKMNTDILELAKNSPLALADLSNSLFDSVSAGIDASKAVDFVGVSAKLAVAGLTNATVSTDALTSAIHAYGYEAQDAELLAAKFFAAQKRGKTTVEQLATDFGKVAALAKSTGVSFDEVLGSVSAATLGAIKTNEAYTSLKAILSNVQKPAKGATDVAEELGIQFNSAALRSKGLVGFLKSIMDAAKSKNMNINEVFEKAFGSVEALNLATALTGQQFESFTSITAELGDEQKMLNGFSKAYTDIADTQNNKIDVMKNKFRVLAINIGEKLAPTVSKVIDKFAGLFSWIEKNPKIVEFGMVFAGLAAMIAPVLIPIGFMISSISSMITGITSLIALKAGLNAFLLTSGMSAGTAALAFAKLAAGILAIPVAIASVSYVLYNFITRFDDVMYGMINKFQKIADWTSDLFSDPSESTKKQRKERDLKRQSEFVEKTRPLNNNKSSEKITTNKSSEKITTLLNQAPAMVGGTTNTNVTENKVVVDFKNMPQGVKVDTKKVQDKNIGVNYGFQGATK
jgi:TP901 family phage tail tape measure protein